MVESVLLFVILVIWLVVEVPMIVVTASGMLGGGARRLDRVGALFLGTEAWTLALIGTGHAMVPGASHQVLHEIGWALAVFVAGWMLRDLGLWLGPRSGGGYGWRLAVGIGAVAQAVGALALIIGWIVIGPELTWGAGSGMLVVVVPPVLVLGVCLLVVLWQLSRQPGYFRWVPPLAT